MQNRRDFLKGAASLIAGGMIAPQLFTSCQGGSSSNKPIGLQLYSLRDMVKEDGIQKTLEAVAKIGYKNLETASYDDGKIYGLKPSEFKKMAEDLGLKATSAHLGQNWNAEKAADIYNWWDKAVEAHNELGVKYMIQPFMPVNSDTTVDSLKAYCDYFTQVGYKTAAASIQFGYHNHDFEFATQIDGKRVYDILLENVSKNHVLFELDVYWAMVGGVDPVEYMKKYSDQIRVLHIKDEKELGASGKMNFEPIFNQMYAQGIKDYYVEVERYTNNNPLESVTQSFELLDKAAYVQK